MKSDQIRQTFIDFFKKHGHVEVPSSRLIPENDPTLLFTNAGMNQFKNVFLGLEQRDYKRAVSAQKCVRAGGKHNDLENVGHTRRHHTFFEMMGNFSFGDYFKKEAIRFAWELVTKEFGIDKNRLYISVFQDDDETAEIWHKQEGVPRERIYRFGEKDNFWRMGDTGPCGPCSEIFYDLGPEVGGDPKQNVMGGEGDRYMEIWNLVFMQYFEDGKGGRSLLPKPSVDTGMGLERASAVLQNKLSNYDTDLFQDIIQAVAKTARREYGSDPKTDVALRVMADHARAAGFLIADGVLPSNEGRGYVLRRILRRAIRYGRQLSHDSLLPVAVREVVRKMGSHYAELEQRKNIIDRTVQDEERRFLATLDQGTHVLAQELDRLATGGTLSGEVLFKLYDTYGFPVDLTRIMAAERGFKVDELGFEQRLEAAKEKARASWKGKTISGDQAFLVTFSQNVQRQFGETPFTGYGTTVDNAKILKLADGKNEVSELKAEQSGVLVCDKTCFYAEGGGQVGDRGVIRSPTGEAEVLDCTKMNGVHLHHVRVLDGELKVGDPVQLVVDQRARQSTANNHSATHLLHAALRKVLGAHVQQAGSLVEPERLRFDFTHPQPLSRAEIEMIENLVNEEIDKGTVVEAEVMPHKAALEKGALALFGEKYGEEVRVIKMGEFSIELCGGTHVAHLSQIRLFKIYSESGVSAGVRRIEAVTGERAVQYALTGLRETEANRQVIGSSSLFAELYGTATKALSGPEWSEQKIEEVKKLQREIQNLKGKNVNVDSLAESARPFRSDGIEGRWVFADIPMDDRKVLSDLSDRLQDKLKPAVVVLVGQGQNSHPLIVSVSKSLTPKLNAGKILGEIASALGGKGGGRPDFAQGAVPSRQNLAAAQAKASALLEG